MARTFVTRAAAIGAVLMALGGCLAVPQDGSGEADLFGVISTVSRPVGEPLPQAPIAGGDILVRGPEGYCVEGRSLRNRADGGFALLASCFVMSGGKDGSPVAPVVMTVSASEIDAASGVPDPRQLAGAFAPARVLAATRVKGVSVVHLATGGEKAVPRADPRHWRGAMELNGHLVLLALYSPAGSQAAERGGSALLVELAQTLRAARPRPAPEPEARAPAPAKRDAVLGGLLQ